MLLSLLVNVDPSGVTVFSKSGMSGWGGNTGGAPPFWSSNCEATTSPVDLSHTVLGPPEGVSYHPGEQISVNWQSGVRSDVLRIDGPPWAGGFHPASWLWSAFLQSEDEKTSVTIIGMQAASLRPVKPSFS